MFCGKWERLRALPPVFATPIVLILVHAANVNSLEIHLVSAPDSLCAGESDSRALARMDKIGPVMPFVEIGDFQNVPILLDERIHVPIGKNEVIQGQDERVLIDSN